MYWYSGDGFIIILMAENITRRLEETEICIIFLLNRYGFIYTN